MGKRTGKPRGRPPGRKDKISAEQQAKAAKLAARLEAAIPEAFTGNSHAFLMTIYKDPMQDLAARMDAAKAALPYEAAKLEAKKDEANQTDGLTTEQKLAAIREVSAEDSGKVVPFKGRG